MTELEGLFGVVEPLLILVVAGYGLYSSRHLPPG